MQSRVSSCHKVTSRESASISADGSGSDDLMLLRKTSHTRPWNAVETELCYRGRREAGDVDECRILLRSANSEWMCHSIVGIAALRRRERGRHMNELAYKKFHFLCWACTMHNGGADPDDVDLKRSGVRPRVRGSNPADARAMEGCHRSIEDSRGRPIHALVIDREK